MISLTDWLKENIPDEKLIYKNGLYDQCNFVRYDLISAMGVNTSTHTYDEFKDLCKVASTHMSKSVLLPVFYLEVNCNHIVCRYNFYNWNVSISLTSEVSLPSYISDYDDYLFLEGMQEYKYDSYKNNKKRFSFACNSNYEFYYFTKLMFDKERFCRK